MSKSKEQKTNSFGLVVSEDRSGIWEDHEKDDFDYGRKIVAVSHPELVSATSVDMLLTEKQTVEAAEKSDDRVRKLLKFIYEKESEAGGDPIATYIPTAYPTIPKSGCFC